MSQQRADRDAAAQPKDKYLFAFRPRQEWQMSEHILSGQITATRGVRFPIDPQNKRACGGPGPYFFHLHRGIPRIFVKWDSIAQTSVLPQLRGPLRPAAP